MTGEFLAALWQGGLLFLGLTILFAAGYIIVYLSTWGKSPHWFEGFRDRFKLRYVLDNRFWLWIHQDTQYWVVRVRFDRGPIVVEGVPSRCRYWSICYYPAREHKSCISTGSAQLDGEGKYRITLSQDVEDSQAEQSIRVDRDTKRGIIELRVTLPDVEAPVALPSVYQNGVLLVEARNA